MAPQTSTEATGLLALMLLHDSRRDARLDDAGDIIVLEKQDRSRWNQRQIAEALPLGTVAEIHQYGRQLLAQKKAKEAFDAFKLNYDKHPNEFTTNMGMARGLSANGDYKKALDYMKKAEAQAPDKPNKDNIDKLIPVLEQGKDIN